MEDSAAFSAKSDPVKRVIVSDKASQNLGTAATWRAGPGRPQGPGGLGLRDKPRSPGPTRKLQTGEHSWESQGGYMESSQCLATEFLLSSISWMLGPKARMGSEWAGRHNKEVKQRFLPSTR